MIVPILESIGAYVKGLNPGFASYVAGANQNNEGRVLLQVASGEYEYVGLNDKRGDYFYVRNETEISFSTPEERTSSCNEIEGEFIARIVAVKTKGNISKMIQVLTNDLMTYSEEVEGFRNVRILPGEAISDFEELWEQETLREDKIRKEKNKAYVAVSFQVRFNYKAKAGDCLDRNICDPC